MKAFKVTIGETKFADVYIEADSLGDAAKEAGELIHNWQKWNPQKEFFRVPGTLKEVDES